MEACDWKVAGSMLRLTGQVKRQHLPLPHQHHCGVPEQGP